MVKRLQDHAHHCLCRFCNYKYWITEIIIDGLLTHRVFAFLEFSYNVLIASFEILAALVLFAVGVFFGFEEM
jgi:hypothetical protein